MKGIIFALLVTVHLSYGVIYRLNDTEYLRMPPLYHLEDYESCVHQPNGTYCYVDIDLVSDTHSDLLQMIHEYSEHSTTHFNHTRLHRGICLTKACEQFLQDNKTVDQRIILERCLNESFWKNYKLKTRLHREVSCRKLNMPMDINVGDIIAAIFFTFLISMNVIGSLYDFLYVKEGKGNIFFLSFSVKRNWAKLISQGTHDQSTERLKGIQGIRTITAMYVIVAHAITMIFTNTENPHGLEKTYDNIWYHAVYSGSISVQTFFILTGCLLTLNMNVYAEKNDLNWTLIPKGIVLRWLRLTPANAVVLMFVMTWMRFISSGPLWESVVGAEVNDCCSTGWANMIYLNNYIGNSQCMVHTWYLAADMQLYIMGLIVCVFAKTARSRNVLLAVLFIIGLIVPGIFTYLQDLDGIVTYSPELARNYYVIGPTLNQSKRGHTNIPAFVIGLALGNMIHRGLKDEESVKNFKKLGVLYNLSVPMYVAFLLGAMVFYQDQPRFSIYVRAIVACFVRPFFSLLMVILLIGMIFKFENVYRRILEWNGWILPARVSYSAYLIHEPIIRIFGGMNRKLLPMGLPQFLKEGFVMIFISFLIAYPFWLFVETPLNQAVLCIMGFLKNDKRNNKAQKIDVAKKQT